LSLSLPAEGPDRLGESAADPLEAYGSAADVANGAPFAAIEAARAPLGLV